MIDPFRFARKGKQLERILGLRPEGRLQGIIAEKCDINLQLSGNRDSNNRLLLEGHISGAVIVQCQVCLDNLQMPVDFSFRLYPVSSEEQAEKLQKDFEPLVVEDNSLALSELVTNELILTLPVAISHLSVDGTNCVNEDKFSAGDLTEERLKEGKSSPFAILKSMEIKES